MLANNAQNLTRRLLPPTQVQANSRINERWVAEMGGRAGAWARPLERFAPNLEDSLTVSSPLSLR